MFLKKEEYRNLEGKILFIESFKKVCIKLNICLKINLMLWIVYVICWDMMQLGFIINMKNGLDGQTIKEMWINFSLLEYIIIIS